MVNFFGSGVLHLRQKLGSILWQFPPMFLFHEEKVEKFFSLLPRTESEATRLARKADRFEPSLPLSARRSTKALRHAMEIRNASFENPDFIRLLRKYEVALVFADTAGKWPYMEDVTSDFLYLRLHGDVEIYKSGYDDESLNWWADRIRLWRSGREPGDRLTISDDKPTRRTRDVYVYFDNDVKVRAPFDAISLNRKLNSGSLVPSLNGDLLENLAVS